MLNGYSKCGLTAWTKEDDVQIINIPGNYEVKVDKWYYDKNCLFDWRVRSKYVCRLDIDNNKTIYMHKDVLNLNDNSFQVDHIDGDTFNNCESNLRLCTQEENNYNRRKLTVADKTSKFKGVSKRGSKWIATIRKNGNAVNIGRYKEEVDAALAYDSAAVYLFEEFACINFSEHKDKLLKELYEIKKSQT